MAKRKITNESLLKKELKHKKEGRGQGHAHGYKPGTYVGEFSSQGNTTRAPGIKTQRGHEFFSDGETNYYHIFEFLPGVTDIREQYLLNKEDTLRIAQEAGIKHSTVPTTTFFNEMTTDFLIDFTDVSGRITQKAFEVKTRSDLNDPKKAYRIIEKVEIQRRYWKEKGVEFFILIKEDISHELITNITAIHYHNIHNTISIFDTEMVNLIEELLFTYLTHKMPISQVTNQLDQQFSLKEGSSLAILYSMIGQHRYVINMHELIDTSKPIQIMKNLNKR